MWMVVMFDLPVVLKQERQDATRFRLTLLDLGFEMTQFSVYMRFCTSQAQLDTLAAKVEVAPLAPPVAGLHEFFCSLGDVWVAQRVIAHVQVAVLEAVATLEAR
jgi:hypothetical protein